MNRRLSVFSIVLLLFCVFTVLTSCDLLGIFPSDTPGPSATKRPIDSEYFSKDFDTSLCSFYDKFEGDSLDLTKWTYNLGNGYGYNASWGWGNEEAQYYQKNNVTVKDGILSITARKEKAENPYFDYTSGKIVTYDELTKEHKFSQTYGRFEAKIRFDTKEEGFWPCFWLMPTENVYGKWAASGEMDIMELKGRFPNQFSSAIHYGGVHPDNKYEIWYTQFPDGLDFTQWHIYGVEWAPGSIKFLIDGKIHITYRNADWRIGENPVSNAPFDQEFYMALNLSVGGKFDEKRMPADDKLPAALEVSFIRVYTLENNPWGILV